MKVLVGIVVGLLLVYAGYSIAVVSEFRSYAPIILRTYKSGLDERSKLLIEMGRKSEADSLDLQYNVILDSMKNIWQLRGVNFDENSKETENWRNLTILIN